MQMLLLILESATERIEQLFITRTNMLETIEIVANAKNNCCYNISKLESYGNNP